MKCEDCGNEMRWEGSLQKGSMVCDHCANLTPDSEEDLGDVVAKERAAAWKSLRQDLSSQAAANNDEFFQDMCNLVAPFHYYHIGNRPLRSQYSVGFCRDTFGDATVYLFVWSPVKQVIRLPDQWPRTRSPLGIIHDPHLEKLVKECVGEDIYL